MAWDEEEEKTRGEGKTNGEVGFLVVFERQFSTEGFLEMIFWDPRLTKGEKVSFGRREGGGKSQTRSRTHRGLKSRGERRASSGQIMLTQVTGREKILTALNTSLALVTGSIQGRMI